MGATGATGAIGPIGPMGATGATGAIGPIGPTGATGATGAIGPIGPTGATGATGAIGPIGPTGATGATGAIGPIGPTGATGATGAIGPTGLTGPAGATGAIGPIGPTGGAGPTGAVGPQGPTGPAGSANINGTTNFVIKFTNATTGGNSLLFDNGSAVGLGTTTPGVPFHVISGAGTASLLSENTNAANDGLYGVNSAAAGNGAGAGVTGITSQSGNGSTGVWGQVNNTAGIGVTGIVNAVAGTGTAIGTYGFTNQSGTGAAGARGDNASTAGTGMVGAGNNQAATVLVAGSGGSFTGSAFGVAAFTTAAGAVQSIYASNVSNAGFVRVNYYSGVTQYKINGSGSVSTIVRDPTDPAGARYVTLHAPEAPEIYFEDYGEAQLEEGFAHVELDPIFVGNVTVNERHPLRVFIQLEDNEWTRGVVVKNKTPHGFDVVELDGGASDMPFQWHIVANRADETMANGIISYNADQRFELVTDIQPSASVDAPSIRPRETPTTALLGTPPATPFPRTAPAGTLLTPGQPSSDPSLLWLRAIAPFSRASQ
jgi:hypothetical protein